MGEGEGEGEGRVRVRGGEEGEGEGEGSWWPIAGGSHTCQATRRAVSSATLCAPSLWARAVPRLSSTNSPPATLVVHASSTVDVPPPSCAELAAFGRLVHTSAGLER